MKTLFGAALGALLLSASAMAATPGSPGSVTPQGSAVLAVVSTPYTAHASGSEQMPVFDYTAPAGEPADPVVVSASQFPGASAKLPVFSYRGAVPVNGSAGGTAGQNSRLFPSTTYLVNQTGGGR